uniref:Uncharacterized protein n=1 Tax=Anguilla anguilla TaxID=7936 RepID=A0A0E9PUM5_ANGAN
MKPKRTELPLTFYANRPLFYMFSLLLSGVGYSTCSYPLHTQPLIL